MSSSFSHSLPPTLFKWTLFSTFFFFVPCSCGHLRYRQHPYTTDIFFLLVLVEWHGNSFLYFVYERIQLSFWFMRTRGVRQNGRCRRIVTKTTTTTASGRVWEIEKGIMRIGIVFLGTPPLVRPSVRIIRSSLNSWRLLIQVTSLFLSFSRATPLSPLAIVLFFMPSLLCYSLFSVYYSFLVNAV